MSNGVHLSRTPRSISPWLLLCLLVLSVLALCSLAGRGAFLLTSTDDTSYSYGYNTKTPDSHSQDVTQDHNASLGLEGARIPVPDPVMAFYLFKVDKYVQSPHFRAWVQQQQHKEEVGILTTCGGSKLTANLVILLKVLRQHVRCMLPVEVAFRGPEDMDEDTIAQLAAMFGPLSGLDVLTVPHLPHEMRLPSLGGWVAKTRALLYSRFQKVLMLDVDVVPLMDPAHLFAAPAFSASGCLFWPDAWDTWVTPRAYELLGLRRSRVEADLKVGKGRLVHDTESGVVLIDRLRHSDVLHYLWYINTFAPEVYKHLHGDKDTFALAFALASKTHAFKQLDIPPGGAFRWGHAMLENKSKSTDEEGRFTDGWQLVGFLQHSPAGSPAFLHRTMNKWSAAEQPWPVTLLTGPMPPRWTRFYLAHDSVGQTKGRWWEHVVPDYALQIIPDPAGAVSQHVDATQLALQEVPSLEVIRESSNHESEGQKVDECSLGGLFRLLGGKEPENDVFSWQNAAAPLPAVNVSLPVSFEHLNPTLQTSGCGGILQAMQAAYDAHEWLQKGAAHMFKQLVSN